MPKAQKPSGAIAIPTFLCLMSRAPGFEEGIFERRLVYLADRKLKLTVKFIHTSPNRRRFVGSVSAGICHTPKLMVFWTAVPFIADRQKHESPSNVRLSTFAVHVGRHGCHCRTAAPRIRSFSRGFPAGWLAGNEHITSFGTALAEPEHADEFKQALRKDSAARRAWRPRLWQRINLDNNPRLEPLLNLLVQRQTFVSPTLAIFEARADEKNATPEQVAAFANMMQFFALCHQRGARIVVGSHTSAPLAARGKAYLREVELMAQAGMRPLEIITAATKNNAIFFGAQDRLGTIEQSAAGVIILRPTSKEI